MDITAINNVATRKRMTVEVEKLREKVSRENKNIIKLKVAQDTAYWDLKEKLRQVETNHEKLQQNMLEVQMQYETVSGQYQDEVRNRAETLNKLASTREICTVLEDYCERLRDTLSRCKADQAALYEAYQLSGQVLRDLKTQQVQQDEKNHQAIENLQAQLKLSMEHNKQLQNYFTEEKQRSAAELQEERKKLASVLGKNTELVATNTELGALVDHTRRESEKKEDTISGLQRDIKQLIQEFNSQANDMKNSMFKQEKELKETLVANESLKQGLLNQETFTKSVCEQNNQLQEKLALLEEEHAKAEKLINELQNNLQQTESIKESLNLEIAALSDKNADLEKDIANKNEIISNSLIEQQKLSDQLAAMRLEKTDVLAALEQAAAEVRSWTNRADELIEVGKVMETKIKETEDAMKASREAAESKIKAMTATIEEKNKELDSKTSTISHLMNEVKNISDSRANLEINIQRVRQELVEEKDAAGEMEKRLTMKVEQLEIAVRNKDNELSKKLNVIMELRGEKERLYEKIQNMQNKIDNVQKELTRPAVAPPANIEAEQDDNAVMLTPSTKKSQAPTMFRAEFEPPPVPRKEPKNDSLLFNFLSDSSMDGDNTVDASIVNRRFEAMSRGEPLSPMPLSSLKRRRGPAAVPASQGGLRFKQPSKDEDMSLSQVKQAMQSKPRTFFKHKRHDKSKKDFK